MTVEKFVIIDVNAARKQYALHNCYILHILCASPGTKPGLQGLAKTIRVGVIVNSEGRMLQRAGVIAEKACLLVLLADID